MSLLLILSLFIHGFLSFNTVFIQNNIITVLNGPGHSDITSNILFYHMTGFKSNFLRRCLKRIIPCVTSEAFIGFYLIVWLVWYVLLYLCVHGIFAVDVWVVSVLISLTHVWYIPLFRHMYDPHVCGWTYMRHLESKSAKDTARGWNLPTTNAKVLSRITMGSLALYRT